MVQDASDRRRSRDGRVCRRALSTRTGTSDPRQVLYPSGTRVTYFPTAITHFHSPLMSKARRPVRGKGAVAGGNLREQHG